MPFKTQVILFLLGPHWIKVPPLSLVYLENFLSQNGFKVKIIDLNIIFYNLLKIPKKEWLSLNPQFENNIYSQIKEKSPEIIERIISDISNSKAMILGFSLFNRNRKATIDFVNDINKVNQSKTLVFGGPEVLFEYYRDSFFSEINHRIDSYFVLGEGELPLLKLCKHIYNSKEISFSLHKGKKIIKYSEIENPDSLPFLNFDHLNLEFYNAQTIPLFSSRGCIKRCTFCSECKLFKNFRQHSPEYMVKLIKNLVAMHEITTFSFHDSLINAILEWLDKFCSLLIKENLKIKWEAQLAIRNDMSLELFEKMKLSGCYNLFVGLESGSDKILKLMHKGYTSKQAKEFFEKLSQAKLQFEISLIVGFPEENENDFKQTLEFIKQNKKHIPKIAQVNPFVEYAPSRIHRQTYESAIIAKTRVNRLLEMFEEEKIKHTASFVNNLSTK